MLLDGNPFRQACDLIDCLPGWKARIAPEGLREEDQANRVLEMRELPLQIVTAAWNTHSEIMTKDITGRGKDAPAFRPSYLNKSSNAWRAPLSLAGVDAVRVSRSTVTRGW